MRSIDVIRLACAVLLCGGSDARAQDFSFLCDGINASGNFTGDGCGPCNATTAARWEQSSLSFRYDRGTRPSDVSSTRWASEIETARASWSAVMGLPLSDGGDASYRDVGAHSDEQEIFWSVTASDWSAQTLSNVNTTMAITAPRHDRCSGGRALFDADIVMNGVAFDWSINSSLSTLTHEMGHAVGLSHPCIECSELMAALTSGGGLDPDGPQMGDVAGVQQLYPAPGARGTACDVDGDCDSSVCATAAGARYCTQTCTTSCPAGMLCAAVEGEGQVCVFSGSEIAVVGDACGPPGCADSCDASAVGPGCNFCVLYGADRQCMKGCNAQTGAGCDSDEECATIFPNDTVSGACIPSGGEAQRNQPCGNGCAAGLVCVNEGAPGMFCRADCDATTGAGCMNDENCLAVYGDGTASCFPIGPQQEGDGCTTFTECARGVICLDDNLCHQRCDQGFACTDAEQDCVATSGASFCSPIVVAPSEGEGEGEAPSEGEGEQPSEGEGEAPSEGEGEAPGAGEGEGDLDPSADEVGDDGEGVLFCRCAGANGKGPGTLGGVAVMMVLVTVRRRRAIASRS